MNNQTHISNFLKYLSLHGVSPKSLKYYKSDLNNFLTWSCDRKVTSILIQEYISSARLITPTSTLNRRISTLRSYGSFLGFKKTAKSWQDSVLSKFESKQKFHNLLNKLFFSRPNWYKKYHSYPLASYIHIAILVLFTSLAGYALYDQVFKTADNSLAFPTALTRPNRFLSFQGRLTDNLGNPKTVATNMVFKLYSVSTAGTALWDSGTCSITPDQDGIFSTLLGSSCGAEIAATVFSENASIWLGATMGADAEATPRVQIATVAYALNSETLQGYPAGTGTSTVPYINSSGSLVLANASPKIQSTSGTFAIEGVTMTLTTPNTSNGVITVNPDGTGTLDLTFEGTAAGLSANGFLNATNANITSGALYGGTVASAASGYNFVDYKSGVTPTSKFSVSSTGQITTAAGLTIGTTSLNETTAANDSGAYLVGAFDEFDNSANTNVQAVLNDLDAAITSGGASSMWTLGSGVIYPTSATNDFAIGGSTLAASMFGIDESAGNFYFGYDNSANPTLNFEATDADAGEFGFNTNDAFFFSNANVGIGTTGPDAKLDSLATTEQLRLTYTDGTVYSAHTVDSSGNLTINNTGTKTVISDNLEIAGTTGLTFTGVGGDITFTNGEKIDNDTDGTLLLTATTTEISGNLKVTGGNILNSAGTANIIFSSTPTTTANTLSASNWLVENTANVGQAALMVNNTKAGDLFTASASGITKFAITNAGIVKSDTIGTAKANVDIFELTNHVNAADMDTTRTSILFNQWYYDATTPAIADAGRLTVGAETDWTSTASTQDTFLSFDTALDGTLAEKMRITSGGNVGIGTTAPGQKLSVIGDVRATGLVQALQSGGSNYMFTMDAANAAGPRLQLGTSTTPSAYFEIGAYNNRNNFDSKDRDLRVYNAGGVVFIQNSSGNVGIGTTNPASTLSVGSVAYTDVPTGTILDLSGTPAVAGAGQVEMLKLIRSRSGASYANVAAITLGKYGATSDTDPRSRIDFNLKNTAGNGSDTDTTVMTLQGNGNVGIGTIAPTWKLTVGNGISTSVDNAISLVALNNLAASKTDGKTVFLNVDSAYGEIGSYDYATAAWKPLVLSRPGAGNVGIGTTGPAAKLDVFGGSYNTGISITSTDTVGAGLTVQNNSTGGKQWDIISTGSSGTGGAGNLGFYEYGSQYSLYLKSGGNVGIGTTSPGNKLSVNGNADFGTTNNAYAGPGQYGALELPRGELFFSNTNTQNQLYMMSNAYMGSGGSFLYRNTAMAAGIGIDNGTFSFLTAASGTAGTAPSWISTMYIGNTGNVGIGTTGPAYKLDVATNHASGYAAYFFNDGNDANRSGIAVQAGLDSTAGSNSMVDFYDGDGTLVGTIAQNSGAVSYGGFTANHDTSIPEEFNSQGYPYGTLLCIDSAHSGEASLGQRMVTYRSQACSGAYSTKILGVYAGKHDNEPNLHQVYILGDGQILVNGEGGDIKVGDQLTTSSTSGIGMKATNVGSTFGVAQEDYHFSSPSETKLLIAQYGLGYHIPNLALNEVGNVTLNGTTLADYSVSTSNGITEKIGAFAEATVAKLKAGIGSFRQVETNLISPVANSDLIIDLQPDNTQVASELVIKGENDEIVTSFDAKGNATISGTLYANNIESDKIKAIEDLLNEVENNQTLLTEAANWNTNTATESGQFSELITNNLFVTGNASMTSLFVSDNFTTKNINSLTEPLSIQSLASSSLEIMAGKIIIDTDGNTKFLGNVEVAGNLKLYSNIVIANNIDPIASESAEVIEGQINTNATAGKALLPAGLTELKILNPKVNDNTLVYVTPVTSTQNKVLYVKSKDVGEFTIGFNEAIDTDVEFNWWIIELEQGL